MLSSGWTGEPSSDELRLQASQTKQVDGGGDGGGEDRGQDTHIQVGGVEVNGRNGGDADVIADPDNMLDDYKDEGQPPPAVD